MNFDKNLKMYSLFCFFSCWREGETENPNNDKDLKDN